MNNRAAQKLDKINQTLEKILGVMQEPKNKIIQALEIFALVAGALSMLYFVDMILSWITGG